VIRILQISSLSWVQRRSHLLCRGSQPQRRNMNGRAFMVIGVLLGWLFLKETSASSAGIGMVFSGVALLSALG
jgi:hypothetical protein